MTEAGGVNVLYSAGSAGLSSTGNQLWTQNSTGLGTAAAHAGHFAWSLASGDFNGNGRTDLAVGAPANTVNGALAAGRITIIAGSAGGLTATGSSNWSENTAGIAGTAEPSDLFGWSIAPLRVTSTGHDDLLVGVFVETLDDTGTADAGEVRLIPGSTGGLTATGSQVFSADTPGIKGNSCIGCGFGYAVG